jgi:hypothetical protein
MEPTMNVLWRTVFCSQCGKPVLCWTATFRFGGKRLRLYRCPQGHEKIIVR